MKKLSRYANIGILAILLVISTFLLTSCGRTDHILTIQSFQPWHDFPHTNLQVTNRLVIDGNWSSRSGSGNSTYVELSGTIPGFDTVTFTWRTVPNRDNPAFDYFITLISAQLDTDTLRHPDAEDFLWHLFDAFDLGYDSFADYWWGDR